MGGKGLPLPCRSDTWKAEKREQDGGGGVGEHQTTMQGPPAPALVPPPC